MSTFACDQVAWPNKPPPEFSGSTVCHMDVSMANVVLQADGTVALIDFEEVGRACAVWDVARTVRHWIPLIAPEDLPDGLQSLEGQHQRRLGLFADAYGLKGDDRDRLISAVLANADATYERMRTGAEAGHPGYALEWTGHVARRNRRGRDWVEAHRSELERAVQTPTLTIGGRDDVSC